MLLLALVLFVSQMLLWREAYRLWKRGPKIDQKTLTELLETLARLQGENIDLRRRVWSLELERSRPQLARLLRREV